MPVDRMKTLWLYATVTAGLAFGGCRGSDLDVSARKSALSQEQSAPRPSHRSPSERNLVVHPKDDGSRLPYEPGVVLVKFKPAFDAARVDGIAADLGLERARARHNLAVDRMRVVSRETVEQAVARLNSDPRVEYAEPNYRLQFENTPNDPRYSECWGMNNSGQTGGTADADIDAQEAWDISIGSYDVIVAVLDTGVDYTHPDLAANIWTNADEIPGNGVDDDNNGFVDDVRGWDFENEVNDPMDDYGHGTHCSGIIGASGNNGMGVAGVNWRVTIMPLRIIGDQDYDTYCIDAAEAVHYAVDNGADIMSCSWWTVQTYSQTLEDAVVYADQNDVFLVAAAGNDTHNDDDPNYSHWPSEWPYDNIIAVAATNHTDNIAYFSNYGPTTVDVGAPGEDVLSTVWPNQGYELKSGTSMAAPHVSGVVALMLSIRPDLTKQEVRQFLFSTVDPIPDLEGQTVTGGRVNAFRVLQAISGVPLPPVAMAGGDRTVQSGEGVQLDGSASFDPNQDPITFAWDFYPPLNSSAALDDPASATQAFTADICGEYQAVLTVNDGTLDSEPDRAKINALNYTAQNPLVESLHPYLPDTDQTWTITQPGAVVMAVHFSQFDTESGWDYVEILDGDDQQWAIYDGDIGPFTSVLVTGNTIKVHLTSDGSIQGQGFAIDEARWCDAGKCPAGLGDCDDDPATGPGGCETDTSGDLGNCGWCGHTCAYAHAGASCTDGLCQFTGCDTGWTDCDNDQATGCEADLLADPQNCGTCGLGCGPYPNATAGCAGGQCAIDQCDAGFGDCNGNLADGCEFDVSSDLQNCGACGNVCALPHADSHACIDGVCIPMGACTNVALQPVVETPHPYSDDYDDSWVISQPGAVQLAIHFASFDVEQNSDCSWDYVILRDAQGIQKAKLCGNNLGAFDAEPILGDTIQVEFHSDSSVTHDGFVIDSVNSCENGCATGYSNCDADTQNGCEAETASDLANCGGCGLVCGGPHTASQCANSICLENTDCQAGWGDCNNDPIDGCEAELASDPNNCSACGVICHYSHAAGVCSGGVCELGECNQGFGDCNANEADGCETSTSTDPNNCGACNSACDMAHVDSASCEQSVCQVETCEPGWDDCDGINTNGCELDVSADLNNCGACGNVCVFANGAGSCTGGMCVVGSCDAGFADCNGESADGCEVDLNGDAQNCGACDSPCVYDNAAGNCNAGVCEMGACGAGFGDCNADDSDGCETDINNDEAHCGDCDTVCDLDHVSVAVCESGQCEIGMGACDTVSYQVSTPHPYPENYNETFVVSAPGALQIRVHFSEMATESSYDYVYILDGQNNQLASYTGSQGAFWSPWATGDTIKANLVSDYMINDYGFDIDMYSACATACEAGWDNCDGNAQNGCEFDVSADPQNCGACGNVCVFANGAGSCVDGACVVASCDAGFADCNGEGGDGCETDLNGDPENCSACGIVCEFDHAGAQCIGGVCAVGACEGTWADCNGEGADGCETDTTSDANNCGACNQICDSYLHATPGCQNSTCGIAACDTGFGDCDGIMLNGCEADVSADYDNCGACGRSCDVPYSTDVACVDNQCVISACTAGFGDCDGDGANGCETVLDNNPDNCGACGRACDYANGTGSCEAGSCVMSSCDLGFGDCNATGTDGCEVDLMGDAGNCGMCGYACSLAHATTNCLDGFCVVDVCENGFENCNNGNDDGCEVDIDGDATNCGSCDNVCELANAESACVSGTCAVDSCKTGFDDCNSDVSDGCEVDLLSTLDHCGDCGTACAFANAGANCVQGACEMGACSAAYADCNLDEADGCETDVNADDNNCGACGRACHQGQECSGGSCVCVDTDGDGYASVPCGDDCNDASDTVHPGADEICDDGIDNDCDGATDEGCQDNGQTEGGGCGCATDTHRNLSALWFGLLGLLLTIKRKK
jgi:subtilisin family serine protease